MSDMTDTSGTNSGHVREMSATERLRALLDERGVEWMPSVFDPQHETFYSVENGVGFIVTEFPEIQRMSLACDMRITPEQAIDATLGPGTCMAVSMRERDKRPYLHDELVCSKCGCQLAHEFGHVWQHYCPNCGREVTDG